MAGYNPGAGIRAHMTLNLSQAEPIVGDDTYKSPSTYVQVVPNTTPENFSYSGGSIIYNGPVSIRVKFLSTISCEAASAGVLVTFTSGVNGTPNAEFEQTNKLTTGNDVKELSMHAEFVIDPGDTIDFFVKGSNNFTIDKAVWAIDKA